MSFSSAQRRIIIFLMLALLMLLTRSAHFASSINLPSASLACFFLAGLFIGRHQAWLSLFALSVVIDLWSSALRGDMSACLSPAYPFLAVGYWLLYLFGQFGQQALACKDKLKASAMIAGLCFIATSLAFFTSNGSYYWFSGQFESLSISQYSERVARYYLPYLQSPFIYLSASLVLYFCAPALGIKREQHV
ncbi:hypothetical protein [Motilimonas pumila]|uniref:Rod shape-determining protein MreD n=1 Tax=Motilimonas pumila TaxID=2303987 RepID=A0A418YC54_9GAMM|nr:hypothetical protein [Motilimonas pumila]RJG42107.1 hypothetical protein D1Z90_15085 [Motilimonas pumila]